MRDRAFGVEIECGYDGESASYAPECICEYDEVTGEYISSDHCEACCGCWRENDGDGCYVAADLLYNNGFRDWANENIHNDGSGVEIPSPILKGREGLNELRQVMELLRNNGFYTGEADGMHVHHDAPEFVADESLVARLVEMWEENLPVIDSFVRQDRRGGRHWACESYTGNTFDYPGKQRQWEAFKASKSLGDLSKGKFRSLNITTLKRYGTVEFRLHEGTLDFNEAAAWIRFGQEFLETVKRSNRIVTCASVIDLMRVTHMSPKGTRTLVQTASRKGLAYA